MENAGLGKALFRKPHFLKHLQGFTKFTCFPAFKHRARGSPKGKAETRALMPRPEERAQKTNLT
jgi:hypothetical protein